MKILTLFIALFLALMPESVSFANNYQGQDICFEEINDAEDEAVIRTPQQTLKKIQTPSESLSGRITPASIQDSAYHYVHLCFQRQWLIACILRL